MKVISKQVEPEIADSGVRQRLYDRYRSDATRGSAHEELHARGPYLRRLVKEHFPADKRARVLDLGCGSGSLLYVLRPLGYDDARGVDRSPEQAEVARELGLNVSCSDLFSFLAQQPAAAYDVIVSFDLLEHLTRTELLLLGDEVSRILAAQGRWIIHTANAEGFFGARVRYADLTHEQAFTRESISQFAHAVGFGQCDCFEDRPVVHGVYSLLRATVWSVARVLLGLVFTAETGERGRNAIFSQNLIAVIRKHH